MPVKVLGEPVTSTFVFTVLSQVGFKFVTDNFEYLISYLRIGNDPAVAVHESTTDDGLILDGVTVRVGVEAFMTVASINAASPKELVSL